MKLQRKLSGNACAASLFFAIGVIFVAPSASAQSYMSEKSPPDQIICESPQPEMTEQERYYWLLDKMTYREALATSAKTSALLSGEGGQGAERAATDVQTRFQMGDRECARLARPVPKPTVKRRVTRQKR